MKKVTLAVAAAFLATPVSAQNAASNIEAAQTRAAKQVNDPLRQVGDGVRDAVRNQVGQQLRGVADQIAPNQATPNQAVQGQTIVNGQPVNGQPVNGQFQNGQAIQGQPIGGQYQPGQLQPGQRIQGQTIQGQPLQGGVVQGQPAQGQFRQGQVIQGQFSQGQSSQGQYSQNQPNQNQSGQNQNGQSQSGQPMAVALVNKLMDANKAEVELANMVLDKVDQEDVRQFAKQLADEHKQLNQDLEKLQQQISSQGQSGAMVPQQLVEMGKQACQNKLQATKDMMSNYNGQDLQMAFVGQQIVAHVSMISELKAIESTGPQELRDFASKARQKQEDHLERAKRLAEKLEDDSRNQNNSNNNNQNG